MLHSPPVLDALVMMQKGVSAKTAQPPAEGSEEVKADHHPLLAEVSDEMYRG